jgi:hypothetical protein
MKFNFEYSSNIDHTKSEDESAPKEQAVSWI